MLVLSTDHSRPLWQVRQLIACGADVNIRHNVRTADATCASLSAETLCREFVWRIVVGAIARVPLQRRMCYCEE